MSELALLAFKVAPNVFDLSSGMTYASLRDQAVRSWMLARAVGGVYKKGKVLIVGAGVAGIAAAVKAVECGMDVTLVDKDSQPLELQSRAHHRWVGPFMYEWPAPFSRDQRYPSRDEDSFHAFGRIEPNIPLQRSPEPVRASLFARDLKDWFFRFCSSHRRNIRVVVDIEPSSIKNYIKKVSKSSSGSGSRLIANGSIWNHAVGVGTNQLHPAINESFDTIFLCSGMGLERKLEGVESTPFWEADHLREQRVTEQRTAIVGGGDGAIQDALRAILTVEHPLELVKALEASGEDFQSKQLLALSKNFAYSDIWETSGNQWHYQLLDGKVQRLAREAANSSAVRTLVSTFLRPGSGEVVLFRSTTYFTKCYLLNLFSIYLIIATQEMRPEFLGKMRLSIEDYWDVEKVSENSGKYSVLRKYDTSASQPFDVVIARMGVDSDTAPGRQMLGIQTKPKTGTINLNHLPIPIHAEEDAPIDYDKVPANEEIIVL